MSDVQQPEKSRNSEKKEEKKATATNQEHTVTTGNKP